MAATPQVPNRIANDRFGSVGNSETGITAAAGGGQTNATALTAQLNVVETVATAADSVKLPKIVPDAKGFKLGPLLTPVVVVNADASDAMQVFGASPDTINDVATGTGVSVPAGKTAVFYPAKYTQSTDVGKWYMHLSA